ncbi:organic solvent tolerance protein OstA [Lacipirellula parvula]|uniref:LptD C-terminal domain-containing protein n=1 Tax=Lacipirellula parvula TaxID=2650471 RepID=A0A5K7XLC6_9BACT|nr:organic solvent tolerance protein OstA [Lacipirellula parvula]BBO36101.1 hypothetical protein PLANPX_5713 [Lacipirellula parvula]
MEGDTLIIAQHATRCQSSLRANNACPARSPRWTTAMLCAIALLYSTLWTSVSRADDIQVASTATHEPISVAADSCTRWKEGVYDVWHLRGNCYLNQGLTYARGSEAVLWIDAREANGPTKVIAYFEAPQGGHVAVDFRRAGAKASEDAVLGQQKSPTWFQRLETAAPLRWNVPAPLGTTEARPVIYERGLAQFNPDHRRQLMLAQYTEFVPNAADGGATILPPGMVKIDVFGRSDASPNVTSDTRQGITMANGGIRIVIDGLTVDGMPAGMGPLGQLDLSTDRAVIWSAPGLTGAGGVQSKDAPLEIYMEGNIEFRQGDRVVYADRMFYDVRRQIGVILNAELLTPLPRMGDFQYPGLVRLKADSIRQLDASHFSANNALITTSRLEEPTYDLSSQQMTFTDVQQPVVDPLTGMPVVAPDGSMEIAHQQMATAESNVIHMRGVPVFYWPRFATNLQDPSLIINRIRIGNDNVFGTQAMIDWDAYELLGMKNAPEGTDWNISTDYLSERGFGYGTDYQWNRNEIFGFVGPSTGILDFWAIKDHGHDNLGLGRRDITPEKDFRFRLFGQHRQRLENGWEVTAESGWVSDTTFLNQYYEREWDELRSPRTGVRARRYNNNREWMLEANAQVNSFWSETQSLPRVDHYWLGESLLDDRLTWFEHSQASYSKYRIGSEPTEPTLQSQWDVLPWEANVAGEKLATRQELDLPMQWGAVKVVPYALGELARWGEALDGEPLDRAYVQTGVRASLPMWATYDDVRDPLFNLNGLAHKVVFDAEFSYADANANYDELPMYDFIDDTSIIEMIRRLQSGALPPTITSPKFDPRNYLFRTGIQGWVTSPSAEIVDDLMALRMGMRHRLQTKRGPAGNQHIVDWFAFDMNATLFPDPNRDNFGEEVGLIDYDMRWNLGDRFSIVSDGYADVFGEGLRTISGGVVMNRPTRGNIYAGVRSITGPITSNVVMGSYSYRLSEKWLTTASAAYDFDSGGDIGETMTVTRIGESMLMTVGFNVDHSKNSVGVNFMLEPRFLPNLRITKTTGIDIPPAGAMGLE